MKKQILSFTATTLFSACLMASASGMRAGELPHDQVIAVKQATGLLDGTEGTGTAFCVSETGLFITCSHVVKNAKPGSLTIVLNPTENDETKYPVHVVHTFTDSDLVVLKADVNRPLSFLKLGDDSTLLETQTVFIFGYPSAAVQSVFKMKRVNVAPGVDRDIIVPPAKPKYAGINVNSGHFTALQRTAGRLEAIQLDTTLNPGNSGGPVLDDKGDVIGIIEAGKAENGMNLAIAATFLKQKLNAPVVNVETPEVKFEDRFKPVDFAINLDWLLAPAAVPAVAIDVTSGGQTQHAVAVKGVDGKYHASLPPFVANGSEKIRPRVTLQFASGNVVGTVDDFPLSIPGGPKLLSQFQTIAPAENGTGFLADGTSAGTLPELAAVKVDFGGAMVVMDCRKATRIDIDTPSQEIGPVSYKVTVSPGAGEAPLDSEDGNVTILTKPIGLTATPLQAREISNIAETRSIPLPVPADDVVAAEDGRLLIFHLKDAKKLAVFDVVDLKFLGYISLAEGPVLYAGGSHYLLVAYPSENLIERYSLQTLQKDRTLINPMGELKALAMGYSSPQYALFVAKSNVPFDPGVNIFNADTMALVASNKGDNTFNSLGMGATDMDVRASADGRTYGFHRVGVSPTGFSIVTYKNHQLSLFYAHESPGLLVPGADGSEIFTSETGVFTPNYTNVVKENENWMDGTCFLPSTHPSFFIGVPYTNSPDPKKRIPKPIAIYTGRSGEPLAYLDKFDEMPNQNASIYTNGKSMMTPDKRYHFYPQLNLFITIPATNDRIVARPIDVKKILDDEGVNYLYAVTAPPQVRLIQRVNFKIAAVSKAGGVTFSLQSGPQGLTVGRDGTVTWQAPAKPAEETVIVSMKDTSGQEAYYTFQMIVTD